MTELRYQPTKHRHAAFLKKSSRRIGFKQAYEALASEYAVASELLKARTRAGLTQETVATRMGTSKSMVSRLEAAGSHSPSLSSLQKYAKAVGCVVQVKLVPENKVSSSARAAMAS
jgi:ribosome-binding protein aMBF1 (putative translation factor)